MVRFRCKSCLAGTAQGCGGSGPRAGRADLAGEGAKPSPGGGGTIPRGTHGRRSPPQASVGPKTRSAERGSHLPQRCEGQGCGASGHRDPRWREDGHGPDRQGPGPEDHRAPALGGGTQAHEARTARPVRPSSRGRGGEPPEPEAGRGAPRRGCLRDAPPNVPGHGGGGRSRGSARPRGRQARSADPRPPRSTSGQAARRRGSRKIRAGGRDRRRRRSRAPDGGHVNEIASGSEGDQLRVLVCDDHALFRRGLQMVLDQEPDLELVGEASDGVEAVEKAQELMPDVILMDVRMPKRSGIEAAGQIRDALPHVKILMLTISDEEADLYEAIKAGASGYLLKEVSIDEVAEAIRSVSSGQSRLSPSMAAKLLTEFAAMSRRAAETRQLPAPRLTDREMEVLRLVAQGLNNRDIAKQLFISENTVKNHIRNILEKLHLHSRMEAVVYAVREKLLEIK